MDFRRDLIFGTNKGQFLCCARDREEAATQGPVRDRGTGGEPTNRERARDPGELQRRTTHTLAITTPLCSAGHCTCKAVALVCPPCSSHSPLFATPPSPASGWNRAAGAETILRSRSEGFRCSPEPPHRSPRP